MIQVVPPTTWPAQNPGVNAIGDVPPISLSTTFPRPSNFCAGYALSGTIWWNRGRRGGVELAVQLV